MSMVGLSSGVPLRVRVARSRGLLSGMALSLCAVLAGCGTPGAPLPPSLKLPDPVTDLTAVRTGNQVALAWTMPRRNTDKLQIKGNIPVRVCRAASAGGCDPVGAALSFAPNAKATFTDALPAALASGAPRALTYFVELQSPRGRTAGPSNRAHVLAGEAPAVVTGLAAELRKGGAVLRWAPEAADEQAAEATVIRLHRTLLPQPSKGEPAAKASPDQGFLGPEKEPLEQTLLVDSPSQPGQAIDKTISFGETYEYRAQRVARVTVDGQTVELAGPLSVPIRVEAIDTFPPAIPAGLAAVATTADAADHAADHAATGPAIDLSWLPVTEADLAGYAVYRREGEGAWRRISPEQPVVGPAFHDPTVVPGHAYRYAVTAIDKLGHESARSAEAEETVPAQ
jgi:hypothetical protein